MKITFTFSIALLCLFASSNSVAQSCSVAQLSPTFSTTSIDNTSGSMFTWTNTLVGGQFQGSNSIKTMVTSPAMFYSASKTSVSFAYNLQATNRNGATINGYTITVVWGTPQTSVSCSARVGTTFSNTAAPYVFTLSGISLPANTNFQVSLSLDIPSDQHSVSSSSFKSDAMLAASFATLPVHIAGVSVRKAAEGAQLTWNVGAEENVSGYDVEKSTDGRNFAKIGFMPASSQSAYSFTDSHPGLLNYYRVKSVDLDGRFNYSIVVSLDGGTASVVVKAFMSDKNTLAVQHDAAASGSRISVISMDGRVMKVQQPAAGAQQTKVDMSNTLAGLYIVRYDNGQGGTQSIKVVK